MTELQEQAKALGDPTRHRIFRHLVEAERPVDIKELTAAFGLNHNAIRQHLAKLVAAGLVVETKAPPRGRGRPRLQYTIDPGTESRWGVSGPYERLSLLLSEIIRTGDSAVEVGRRAGRRLRHSDSATTDPIDEMVEEMARQGFEPTVTRSGNDADVVLAACPFASTAVADPGAVCDLHRGMAYGLAETIDGLVVDELVAKDPRRAKCRLRCHVEDPPGLDDG